MKLIFLHIPKAAGTTFHSILQRQYKPECVFDIRIVDKKPTTRQFLDLPKEKKDKINLLKGHMLFGLHKQFASDDVKYITFLRNPVSRVVSLYNYILGNPEHYLYDRVSGGKMSLDTFVTSSLTHELDNDQTRLLSGIDKLPDAMSLETAIDNLKNKFISFGITEKFDESILLFKQQLGWKDCPYYIKQNISKKGEAVSEELKKKIEEMNSLDMKLYEWVKTEFEKNIHSLENLDSDLKVLRSLSDSYAHGYNSAHAAALKTGFNNGYNYVYNKFPFLLFLKKIKSKLFS